jgi:N-acetylglucosaminyl-diphospho-decaprenol L-rhamnosyltransferase
MTTRVSAVVVNYNARDYLVDCVRSLRADGIDEIVLADNASSDRSVETLLASDPAVIVVPVGANLGFGAAANRGVAAATGDVVAIMNPDLVVEPGTTKALVGALDRGPSLAFVGPRIENRDGTVYPSARRFPSLVDAAGHAFLHYVKPDNRFSRRYRMLDWDHADARDVDWVSGTFIVGRRNAYEGLGGFDEAYFMYAEDVDLCWRAWKAGWRVGYEPEGRIIHVIGGSTELMPYRMILAHHRSLLRFAVKSETGPRRLLLPLVAAGLAVRAGLACLQRARRRRPPAAL